MPTATLEKQETKNKLEQKCVCHAPIAIYENSESYTVLVELPGADEKALQVRLDKGVLTVEAPLKMQPPEKTTAIYSELRLGNYRRTLNVGDQIDEEKIEATFTNGLLKLVMPKSKAAKTRKIPIKTA